MGKKDKKKWKKGKKGKKNYKKYSKHSKHGKNKNHKKKKGMGLGTKLLIGAGIAAIAIGGLYLGKYCYDKHKADQRKKLAAGSTGGGYQKREVVDDGPVSPALAKYIGKADPNVYTNSMETIPIPDAVTVGLGWDSDNSTDYDLVAAAYTPDGRCLGVVQGTPQRGSLFNNAVSHTGDNDGTMVDSVLGDAENIVFDLRAVPQECNQIIFGATIVTPPTNIASSKPYLHMLPLMREETIKAQIAAGGTRSIQDDSDSDDDSDSEDESSNYGAGGYPTSSSSSSYDSFGGTRGIGDDTSDDDGRHDFVTMFMAEFIRYPEMLQQRGFVGGKMFRSSSGEWFFTPYRLSVNTDPQYGLFTALDYYAKFPVNEPASSSSSGYSSGYGQQQLPPPNYGYSSQQLPPSDRGFPSSDPYASGYAMPPPDPYGAYAPPAHGFFPQ